MEKRLWIVPENDLESKAIAEMLEREGEKFLVTNQAWGARWEGHFDEKKQEWQGMEIENIDEIKKALEENIEVYGVELQGSFEGGDVINIDHHKYWDDDRSNEKSSIEQVAEILGIELNFFEQFISANDKGYIPAMQRLGIEKNLDEDKIQSIIEVIREYDRKMQGVTPEQEVQAQEAVKKLGDLSERQDYILVEDLPHSKTSTITDRLYGKYDNLLITSQDGETNFYGSAKIIEELNKQFPGGWSGGELDKGNGFWGGYANQENIKKEVQKIIEQNRKEKEEKDEIYRD